MNSNRWTDGPTDRPTDRQSGLQSGVHATKKFSFWEPNINLSSPRSANLWRYQFFPFCRHLAQTNLRGDRASFGRIDSHPRVAQRPRRSRRDSPSASSSELTHDDDDDGDDIDIDDVWTLRADALSDSDRLARGRQRQ